jgi:hypothetical protein
MGVAASEVGYTSATTKREDHVVYMEMWWHWGKNYLYNITLYDVEFLRPTNLFLN